MHLIDRRYLIVMFYIYSIVDIFVSFNNKVYNKYIINADFKKQWNTTRFDFYSSLNH